MRHSTPSASGTSHALDFWSLKREKAFDLGLIKVLTDDNGDRRFYLLAWKPKAKNPFANYVFRTDKAREKYLEEVISSLISRIKRRDEYKRIKKGTPEYLKAVVPGLILHYAWGYDQTNCQFYQIIKVKGRYAWIREIGSKFESACGPMSDYRMALKDQFLVDEPVLKKLINFTKDGDFYLSMSFGCASLWSGKPQYNSWGH